MPIARSEEPNAALAVLGYHAGPRAGEEIALRSPVLTIGQGSQNEVVLADDSISTRHARLEYDAGGWRLTDLGSTNGTYVDGVRLAPEISTPLLPGAVVRFGATTLVFQPVEAADPEAARAGYTVPPAARPLAERKGGFRVPVWLFLLLLVIAVLALFVVLTSPDAAALGAPEPLRTLALAPPGAP